MKTVLEELDIEITEACSADKALKLLNQKTPDLILLDMCMPMMNGIDFLEQLKLQCISVPVVVISVLDDQVQIKQALQTGAREYLIKPIENDELIKCVARYIECEVIL
jgi:CheY-like chemotaxis protein